MVPSGPEAAARIRPSNIAGIAAPLAAFLLLLLLLAPAVSATCHTSRPGCRSNLALVDGRSLNHWAGSSYVTTLNDVAIDASVVSPRGYGQPFHVGDQGQILLNFTFHPPTSGVGDTRTVTYSVDLRPQTPGTTASLASPVKLSEGEPTYQVVYSFTVNGVPDICKGDSAWAVATRTFENRFALTVDAPSQRGASLSTDDNYLYVPVDGLSVAVDKPDTRASCGAAGSTDAPSLAAAVAVLAGVALLARRRRR